MQLLVRDPSAMEHADLQPKVSDRGVTEGLDVEVLEGL